MRVQGVSKSFCLPHEQVHTLKERALHPFRRRRYDRLEALKDVSLEVSCGEFFGIVGRNGSGKSTLMKCLAGIYRADEGDMWLRGRLAPFIELGVGFNPDLSARDNVRINAVMLGLSPVEASERYGSIIAFADLGEFEDLKLKNYSSGMQVRLAFSVMVHVDADVLLIDEVLAVGDAAFQQKCHDALTRARDAGRTILLVTHDMNQVQRYCDRALLLDRGRVVAVGDARTVARRYSQVNFPPGATRPAMFRSAMTQSAEISEADGRAFIVDTWAQDLGGRTTILEVGTSVAMCMRIQFAKPVEGMRVEFMISDERRRPVFAATDDWVLDSATSHASGPGFDVALAFDNWLVPGQYLLSASVTYAGGRVRTMASREDACSFVVTGATTGIGVVDIPHSFHISPAPMAHATD